MNFLIIFLALIGLAISIFAVSPIFAESVETFVIHPHLFDCRDIDGIPQKCMVYKEQNLNPFSSWGILYVPIEGFDYKEWNRYMISVKITDVENPVSPATSKKYELVEILGQESFPPHDPYNGMCAPGFVATTEGNCWFNFRCGPEWSAGRICVSNGQPQPYLKPLQQVDDAGIADSDVICVEHLSLVSKKSDGSSACVTSETRDMLVKRGEWVKHISKASVFQQIAEPKLYEEDFDIPEVRLFLEKYPQTIVLVDQVGYTNHHKQYMHADRLTGDTVGLALMKNIGTGVVSSAISCPSNPNHSEGYEVNGTIDITEYLKNYDCLSDSNVGRFEPTSDFDSKNPEDCPISLSSRCITGTVTEIFNGDTVRVNGALFGLALISSPELDEEGGQEAKTFLEGICPADSDALVDQDDLRPLEGLSGSGRIMAVVYCNGLNLNEKLVEFNFEYFDDMYCHTSEFADDPWAREGCSE